MKLYLLLFVLFFQNCFAQDPYFVQAHNNAMYLNPALTGCFINPVFSLSDHLDLTRPNSLYNTFSASYHQSVRILHGGLGLYYVNDYSDIGTLKTNRINIAYAAHFEINDKFILRVGVTGGYQKRTIDWDKLTFGDMIDPRYGFVYPTTEERPPSSINIFDYGIGMVVYTKRFYVGCSVDHLNQPETSFIRPAPGSRLPRKITINGGLVLPVGDSANNISFIPDILYTSQRDYSETIVSVTGKINYLLVGTGLRVSNVPIIYLGFENKFLRVTYSYDHAYSGFTQVQFGSHEFFLAFKICCIHPKKGNWTPIKMASF